VDRDTLYYYFKQIQEKSHKPCSGPECLADLAAQLDADLFIKSEISRSGAGCSFSTKLYKRKPDTLLYFVEQTDIKECGCSAEGLTKAAHLSGIKLSGQAVDEENLIEKYAPVINPSPPQSFKGSLLLKIKPSGAKVFLDGNEKGQSIEGKPLILSNLIPGAHKIRVEREGCNAVEQDVIAAVGVQGKVKIALTCEPKALPMQTIPPRPGQNLRIDPDLDLVSNLMNMGYHYADANNIAAHVIKKLRKEGGYGSRQIEEKTGIDTYSNNELILGIIIGLAQWTWPFGYIGQKIGVFQKDVQFSPNELQIGYEQTLKISPKVKGTPFVVSEVVGALSILIYIIVWVKRIKVKIRLMRSVVKDGKKN